MPQTSDVGDSLVFPFVADVSPVDDIADYAVSGITIDDGLDYDLEPNDVTDTILLGSGGIITTSSPEDVGPDADAYIDIPVELNAAQTWMVDGSMEGYGLLFGDPLTAADDSADGLTADLSNDAYLGVSGDNEVGPVTLKGANSTDTGVNAYENGFVDLGEGDGNALNGVDDEPVVLNQAALAGSGSIGPLTSNGGSVGTDYGSDVPGGIAVDGSASLDSASLVQSITDGIGEVAGTDYWQLSATGNIALGGARLELDGLPDVSGACPDISEGGVDVLVNTDGTVTGTFANAPASGDVIRLSDCDLSDPSQAPEAIINYYTHGVTATLVKPDSVGVTVGVTYMPSGEDHAGAPVTLTASVSTSIGVAPSGTVEFISTQGPIASCESQPIIDNGGYYQATCVTTLGQAGSNFKVDANFNATANSPDESGVDENPMEIDVVAVPEGILTVSTVSAGAGQVDFTANCGAPVPGEPLADYGACPAGATLAAIEAVRKGKVIGMLRPLQRPPRGASFRRVVIGTEAFSCPRFPASNTAFAIKLNSLGRKLLSNFGKVPGTMTVDQDNAAVAARGVTVSKR